MDSVAAGYGRLARYHFEGLIRMEATGARLQRPQLLEVPFRYAAVRPGKLLNETQNPFMPTTVLADGGSLWVSAPSLQQYVVQKAPVLRFGAEADSVSRALDPVLALAANLTTGLEKARWLGDDTVRTATGPVRCRRVEATYVFGDSTAERVLPRVLWIDAARRALLRDSSTVEILHPRYGQVRQVQEVRYVVADLRSAGPDSQFRFEPPPGSRRVRRLAPTMANDRNDTGKPAPDFTLAVLDGGGRKVRLSDLRGKVVVLDFWATWCGPCRRWMPIVAKLEKEAAGPGVVFYAVNAHEPEPRVRKYVQEQNVQVPVLLDAEGAASTAYGASSIPLTVVVGRDGRIVRSLVGLHPEEDLRDALAEAGVPGM